MVREVAKEVRVAKEEVGKVVVERVARAGMEVVRGVGARVVVPLVSGRKVAAAKAVEMLARAMATEAQGEAKMVRELWAVEVGGAD